ncbi:hypothetical protein BDV95DRAFT_327471 [Massariosphaeria phaeospora]|uniref:Uncharacterized protein n=1 Tax=Massariosphaeria phaeospora TaxID=100035 RepID=A0A7C8IDC0_9PLEO|nr:hypothetical protein BDV95DRAFT_327471 [Massariosphaeria phaeospora]
MCPSGFRSPAHPPYVHRQSHNELVELVPIARVGTHIQHRFSSLQHSSRHARSCSSVDLCNQSRCLSTDVTLRFGPAELSCQSFRRFHVESSRRPKAPPRACLDACQRAPSSHVHADTVLSGLLATPSTPGSDSGRALSRKGTGDPRGELCRGEAMLRG